MDPLTTILPAVVQAVRRTLVAQESAYRHKSADKALASLWTHSARVGRIAHHIAKAEGLAPEPALLAGLFHDTGKFVHGKYHEDDVPEERHAAEVAEKLLAGTIYAKWIPTVSQAIVTMTVDAASASDIGRVVYDADCIDKLGCMGVAQFFAKRALRRHFLDEATLIRASIELTYAHHAADTLKTTTGRSLAGQRNIRTHRFYTELLDEWDQLGLGCFTILQEDIAGIACIIVMPCACACGGPLTIESDIRDALKCRALAVTYRCEHCRNQSAFSFCLPNINGLPIRR